MAAPLTPEQKRLRGLTPGELADEAGVLKADAAAVEDKIAAVKAEALRRKLSEADGELYRMTIAPARDGERLDVKALRAAKGEKFLAPYMVAQHFEPAMKISARPRAK
jgi:hypothetical protein